MNNQSSQALVTSPTASNIRPLTDLQSNEAARIHKLRGGLGFRRRLAALGFTPGTEITMLQNRGHGPVIVTIRDTRVALGRGEACRIVVKSK